jgi:hypothetical protein
MISFLVISIAIKVTISEIEKGYERSGEGNGGGSTVNYENHSRFNPEQVRIMFHFKYSSHSSIHGTITLISTPDKGHAHFLFENILTSLEIFFTVQPLTLDLISVTIHDFSSAKNRKHLLCGKKKDKTCSK